MMLQKLFTKTQTKHTVRTYFGSSWEFWKREITQALWDWGVDGPFCNDPECGQRLMPSTNLRASWRCIRCGATGNLPSNDFNTLRTNILRQFEEEARNLTMV